MAAHVPTVDVPDADQPELQQRVQAGRAAHLGHSGRHRRLSRPVTTTDDATRPAEFAGELRRTNDREEPVHSLPAELDRSSR